MSSASVLTFKRTNASKRLGTGSWNSPVVTASLNSSIIRCPTYLGALRCGRAMTDIRSQPCSACPYRQDCPSGLWEPHEYDKLPPYDAETFAQPFAPFMCHATNDHMCNGWAVCHTNRGGRYELVALRLLGISADDVPRESVPLFRSGAEACAHGKRDVAAPSVEARAAADRLTRKYPRLRGDDVTDDTA